MNNVFSRALARIVGSLLPNSRPTGRLVAALPRLVVCIALLCSLAAPAATYTHSVGALVGGMNGASYKGFILGRDGLALQTDLAVGLTQAAGAMSVYGYSTSGHSLGLYSFEANPNVIYQQPIREFSWGDIDWFVGGGASLGMSQFLSSAASGQGGTMGKFGFNALAGIELAFLEAPLALAFDFRPGYGLAFQSHLAYNYFDWHLTAALRYCF